MGYFLHDHSYQGEHADHTQNGPHWDSNQFFLNVSANHYTTVQERLTIPKIILKSIFKVFSLLIMIVYLKSFFYIVSAEQQQFSQL